MNAFGFLLLAIGLLYYGYIWSAPLNFNYFIINSQLSNYLLMGAGIAFLIPSVFRIYMWFRLKK
jgi:hypothetical protein